LLKLLKSRILWLIGGLVDMGVIEFQFLFFWTWREEHEKDRSFYECKKGIWFIFCLFYFRLV